MATTIKLDSAAVNGAAIKLDSSALNGVAAKLDSAANGRAAALLARAGPLADNFAQTLLQPLGAPDAAAAATAAEIADGIKHEMALALAQPSAALPAEGFGAIARNIVAAAKPEKANAARARAAALVASPPASQAAVFGRFAGKGVEAHAGGAVQVTSATAALFKASVSARAPLEAASFEAALQKGGASFVAAPAAAAAPVARYKKLGFFITKVRCVRDTSGEWGSDEILLSGFSVDPRGRQTHPGVWKVSNDFDKGETVTPNPPRLFAEFDLAAATPRWPRAYIVSLALAEQDHGGFGDMMQQLWAKVGHAVAQKLAEIAGAGIDAETGTGLGTALADYMAKVIEFVLGAVVQWLARLLQDDFIGSATWKLALANDTKAYFDAVIHGASAPPGVMRFRGDGGIYDVTLVWKVYN